MKTILNKSVNLSKEELLLELDSYISEKIKKVIVTANSEILITNDEYLHSCLLSDETMIVLDGIAAHKTSELLNNEGKLLYPGVDLVYDLLEILNSKQGSIAVLGTTDDSLKNFEKFVSQNFPKIEILGTLNGYVSNSDKSNFLKFAALSDVDLLLVALGVPRQEKLIFEHQDLFNHGLLIGCGGSIDVLGGSKTRAPKIFLKTKTEWLYRIISEPNRLPRFLKTNFKLFTKMLESRGD